MARRIPAVLKFALSVLVLLSPLAAGAADQDVAVLRVSSVDAVLNDLERLAVALNLPLDRDELLDDAMSPLQFSGAAALDRSRPAAMVFPARGLVLGVQALAGVLPVSDAEAALLALEGRFDTHGVNESIHTFSRSDGTSVVVRVAEGYLVVGIDETVVNGIDLAAALGSGDLPPGNISVDIFLEEMAPVLQAGLLQGRQMLEMQMEAAAAATAEEDAAGPEETEPGEGGTGEAPSEPPEGRAYDAEVTVEPEFDPQAMMPVMDLYFDFLNDAVNNVSRVQYSIEISGEHLRLHQWAFPRGGSTLAGLVEAQSGGLPDLARLVDPAGAFVVLAGQVKRTPAFDAALAGYATRYVEVMRGLMAGLPEDPLVAQYLTLADSMLPLIEQSLQCYRGDMAGAFGLDPKGGMRMTQVVGAADAQDCRAFMAQAAELMNSVPDGPEGERMFRVTENALTYAGVSANRSETAALTRLVELQDGEEAAELMRTFLGGDGFTGYWGLAGDVLISAMGAEAEQSFKNLVDRSASGTTGGGLSAEFFEPLTTGPGVFVMMDFGALFETMAKLVPDEEGKSAALLFAEASGRMVYGARFSGSGLETELAFPLQTLAKWREMMDQETAGTAPEQERGPGETTPEISHETVEDPEP